MVNNVQNDTVIVYVQLSLTFIMLPFTCLHKEEKHLIFTSDTNFRLFRSGNEAQCHGWFLCECKCTHTHYKLTKVNVYG